MTARPTHLLITCEHGGREIPPQYQDLFAAHDALLETHRGWDPGALELAREMSAAFDAPLFASTTSRLLIDLNRSIGHPQLYSEVSRAMPAAERKAIVERYYRPHRQPVEADVRDAVARGERAIHIASHSFTPELYGVVRAADVGLLYDPRRSGELTLAVRWLHALKLRRPDLRGRRNYPYAGKSDGLTALLRRKWSPDDYVGIELEVNQKHVLRGGDDWNSLRADVIASLGEALREV